MRLYFYILLSGLSLLLAAATEAKNIYVDNVAGNDNANGLMPAASDAYSGPVRTIACALNLSERGDRVILAVNARPYRESITFFGEKNSGFSDEFPFVLEGNGAVIDGADPLAPNVWQHFRDNIFRFRLQRQPINLTHAMLFSDTFPLERVAVPAGSRTIPQLQSGNWCVHKGFLYFCSEPEKTPRSVEDYRLSLSARASGVTLLHSRFIRIHDLSVRGFQVDGISAFNSAREIILDGVQSFHNGRSGLSIGGASRVFAGYSRFDENAVTQILALPFSSLLLYESDFPENGIVNQNGKVDIRNKE